MTEEKDIVKNLNDMTPEERFLYHHENLLKFKMITERSFLEMGEHLYFMKYLNLYKHQFDRFEDYLVEPAINIARQTAETLMAIYRIFIIQLKMKKTQLLGMDYSKLQTILPVVNDENKMQLVDMARITPRHNLRENVRDMNPNRSESSADAPVGSPQGGISGPEADDKWKKCTFAKHNPCPYKPIGAVEISDEAKMGKPAVDPEQVW